VIVKTTFIIADHDGDTWCTVYTVRYPEAIYVLHAFQEKSKRGIATLLCFSFGCHAGVRVVDCVPLSPTNLKIVGEPIGRTPKRESAALKSNPVVARGTGHSITGTGNR
jgi:hypothetical protein